MKKVLNILFLITTFVMLPTHSFAVALEGQLGGAILFGFALISEIVITIPLSIFFIFPLASILSKNNKKKTFWYIFILRFLLYIYFDFCVSAWIFIADYIALLIGWFILIPKVINKKEESTFESDNIIKIKKDDKRYEIEDNNITLDEGFENDDEIND